MIHDADCCGAKIPGSRPRFSESNLRTENPDFRQIFVKIGQKLPKLKLLSVFSIGITFS
jgi:hypothetical protein